MQVTQNVQTQFNTLYVGYNLLEFTDANGNEVRIDVSEDNILEIAKKFRCQEKSILDERKEKAKDAEVAE